MVSLLYYKQKLKSSLFLYQDLNLGRMLNWVARNQVAWIYTLILASDFR